MPEVQTSPFSMTITEYIASVNGANNQQKRNSFNIQEHVIIDRVGGALNVFTNTNGPVVITPSIISRWTLPELSSYITFSNGSPSLVTKETILFENDIYLPDLQKSTAAFDGSGYKLFMHFPAVDFPSIALLPTSTIRLFMEINALSVSLGGTFQANSTLWLMGRSFNNQNDFYNEIKRLGLALS